jgi:general L-amino acid transport system substrate-binding protein
MCMKLLQVMSLRLVEVLFRSVFVGVALILLQQATNAQTLKKVKERGNLICGVNPNLFGFSSRDERGRWTGFDIDFCRALSAAIFNDPQKVQFVPTETADRLQALQSGKVDVLSRNTSWTMSREMPFELNFATVTYYDGQGFLVRRISNVTSALELDGATLCVQSGTTSELNAKDYFSANNMKHQISVFSDTDEARNAYDSGRCNVLSSDTSQLFAERLKLSSPDEHVILPDIISKEPLGPAVHFGDDQWLNIVKWTHFAMLNAEELGVSSETIDAALKSEKPAIRRLVGLEGKYGENIGLTQDWAVRILRHVGNYAEVFERNVGVGSKLNIPRGINSLWTAGGIQYAPPIR